MSNLKFRRVAKTVGVCATDITERDFKMVLEAIWPANHVHPDRCGAIVSLVSDEGWEQDVEQVGYSQTFINVCKEALACDSEFLIIDKDEAPIRDQPLW